MKHKGSKKRIAIIAVNILLTAAALCCLLLMYLLPKKLISQQEAERWQGESEQAYAQTTVLSPRDEKMSINDVYSTRTKLMKKMHEAALDVNNDAELLIDAWSTNGKVSVYSGYGSGNVSALAVGGSYFDFHPITLLSGSYIGENDLMKDRVLLDEEVAWLLYGGTDLQGMSLSINNKNFYVAGVIRREEDFADKRAYSDGMGLYMSYDAYSELFPEAGITCYEVVMPQPVKNFARTAMEELFKGTDKAIIDNTSRFGLPALRGAELCRALHTGQRHRVSVLGKCREVCRVLLRGAAALCDDTARRAARERCDRPRQALPQGSRGAYREPAAQGKGRR